MKYFLVSFAALFLLMSPAQAQDKAQDKSGDKTDDITVVINGMVCDFCAQSLKKVFGKEDSVNGIAVDLDTQTVTIDTKNGQELSDDKIKELVEWGGYDLVSINR